MNLRELWRSWRDAPQGESRFDNVDRNQPKQWFLLAGACDQAELTAPPVERLKPIYPPAEVFWADPFLWSREGRRWIFVEEFPYATGCGRISVFELDSEARPAGPCLPVIEEPYHLSYPFLFEFEDALYMVPEKKAARRVDLYRCIEFPYRWEFVKTLLKGERMVDSTLFEHGGLWWLFCSVKRKWSGLRYDETLFAFFAESPLSDEWKPHSLNPLVRDYSRARSAGRILRGDAGKLIRPSQDCVRRYGDGLNINEISLLNTIAYQERRIWHMRGEDAGAWLGMHHMDWRDGWIVMDALRNLPS